MHAMNVKLLLELKIKPGNLWRGKKKIYEELLNLEYYLQLGECLSRKLGQH